MPAIFARAAKVQRLPGSVWMAPNARESRGSASTASHLGKDLTLRGYQLFEITKDPKRLEEAKAFIVDGLASGALKPVIAKTFKLDAIVEATRLMESNKQVGKIVVTV